MRKFCWIIVVTGLAWMLSGRLVMAQDPGVSTTDVVYESESLRAELRRLKTQYRGEVEEYRRLQDQYQVAKTQYQNLDTLVSLESAVRATQAAMEARDRVLLTYLNILKVSTLEQTGIDVAQKKTAIDQLDAMIAELQSHRQLFDQELDKVGLQNISTDFEQLGDRVIETSYLVLSTLQIGQLQSVYDQSSLLIKDMSDQLATSGGTLKQAQRQRGFEETQRQLAAVKPILNLATQELIDPRTRSYESLYRNSSRELNNVYAELSRSLSFLRELLKL